MGIGTTTSFNALSIRGNVAPGASFDQGVFIDLHNDNGVADYMTGLRFKVNAVDTDERFNAAIFHRFTGSGNELNFAVQPNNAINVSAADIAMTITQAARVGIGTSAPSTLMELQTATGTAPSLEIQTTSASGEASVRFVATSNTFSAGVDENGSFKIADNTALGSNDRLEVNSAGKFLFGGSTEVGGASYMFNQVTTGFGGMYVNTSTGGEPFYGYAAGGTFNAYHYVDGGDANKWKLYVGAVRMTVQQDGDIGIGTTAPSAKLDVVGDVEVNGAIVTPASGTTTVSGSSYVLTKPSRRVVRLNATTNSTMTGIAAGDDGQEVILIKTAGAGVVTLDAMCCGGISGTTGLVLNGGTDYNLSIGYTVHLIYDSALSAWLEIGRGANISVIN